MTLTPDDASATMRTRAERAAIAGYQVGSIASTLMMIGGIYGALVWRPAAFVMLAGAILQMLLHQAVGVIVYRRVMRRPWPSVAPLLDDDDGGGDGNTRRAGTRSSSENVWPGW